MAKVSANPLPVSFKDFVKHPKEAIAFLAIVGITILYVDIRSTFQKQAEKQERRADKIEHRLDLVSNELRKCDSSLASATTKLSTLEQLGKIQHIK